MPTKQYLSAKEAAEELNISRATLYAYVSRGLIRSEESDSKKRTKRYLREDIIALKHRQQHRQQPDKAMTEALHWGLPLLESAITLITAGQPYYVGHKAVDLAQGHSLEQVATLIWTEHLPQEGKGLFETALPTLPDRCQDLLVQYQHLTPVERFQALLPLLALDDWASYDLRPTMVAQTGMRILSWMGLIAISSMHFETDLATTLQQGWLSDKPESIPLLQAALILCADHELNVSSFTARCVASAGATPYQVVIGGLAALQGVKHGRSTERVAALLDEINNPEEARLVLANRLKRGEDIPGFGHPLYPEGDPRGRLLLDLIRQIYPESALLILAQRLENEAESLLSEKANIDFSLVILARILDLPPGGAIAIFALGRTVGWLGHAIEQYKTNQLIRPRAKYVGPQPIKN